MAQDVAAAVQLYPTTSFTGDLRFEVPNIGAFTVDVVEAAWNLSPSRQKQVRTIMVDLVGERRVLMAEQFGGILGPRDHPLGESLQMVKARFEDYQRRLDAAGDRRRVYIWDPHDPEERAAEATFSWQQSELNGEGEQSHGLFGPLETLYVVIDRRIRSEPPDISQQVAPVIAGLERLLTSVGGVQRLGRRAPARLPRVRRVRAWLSRAKTAPSKTAGRPSKKPNAHTES
ncbi:hypothetical protein IPZ70_28215 [Streptomyces polychromogenes]|nr:hypothetical protein [Streptomyces polychromogenes]